MRVLFHSPVPLTHDLDVRMLNVFLMSIIRWKDDIFLCVCRNQIRPRRAERRSASVADSLPDDLRGNI